VARDDFYASPFGAAYSAYMERPRLSRPLGRLVWGGESRLYYESMSVVATLPSGAIVVDCPCGAGPALRAVPADGSVRYIGVDRSPSMLRRARERAVARNLSTIELIEADATEIPLPPASVDLFLSFWGLHCFDDPKGAVAEAARILQPSARLLGACFVRGRDTRRQRLLVRPGTGDFGPIGTQPEVDSWLAAADFDVSAVDRSGPMLFFDARSSA
jgi:SAM-dependent methyltransferase